MLIAAAFSYHSLSQLLARAKRDVFEPLSHGESVAKSADAQSAADSIHSLIPAQAQLGDSSSLDRPSMTRPKAL